MAHFLFEHKYIRSDVEIILIFMNKIKQLINKSLNRKKNENVDGDYPINLEFMTLAYNIINQKDKV